MCLKWQNRKNSVILKALRSFSLDKFLFLIMKEIYNVSIYIVIFINLLCQVEKKS